MNITPRNAAEIRLSVATLLDVIERYGTKKWLRFKIGKIKQFRISIDIVRYFYIFIFLLNLFTSLFLLFIPLLSLFINAQLKSLRKPWPDNRTNRAVVGPVIFLHLKPESVNFTGFPHHPENLQDDLG